MKRSATLAVALVALVESAFADSPLPPPTRHRLLSPNGQFAVVSDPVAGRTRVELASGEQLWQLPGWFRSVYVSNDGEHLAVGYEGLNLVPLDSDDSLEMISFWNRGNKVKSVALREIVPDRSILKRTASHYAWGSIRGVNEHDQLIVTRIDGQVLRFNMSTGTRE